MDGDAGHAQVAAGAHQAQCDFAAVGDEDALEHAGSLSMKRFARLAQRLFGAAECLHGVIHPWFLDWGKSGR
jgi:hypothetical protein